MDFSGDDFFVGAILGLTVDTYSAQYFGDYGRTSHIFYVAVNSNPEVFALHSCRMEKCAQSMHLVAVSLSAARTLESGHYFFEFSISWQFAAVFAAQCSWGPR